MLLVSLSLQAALINAPADPPPLIAPRTRTEVKKSVEEQKKAKSRLPLPPGERSRGNNGSMQRYYLPPEWLSPRPPGPRPGEAAGKAGEGRRGGAFGGAFNTRMFWIVSRTNDCRYCLGHQEAKLRAAGMTEEQIASLDGDWSGFDDKDRAALAYALKITLEPHLVGQADIDALAKHFDPPALLGVISANAGFNRTNRWTGTLNITQDEEPMGQKESLDGPPASDWADRDSTVMPKLAVARRPLESRAAALAAIEAARTRSPRVKLPEIVSAGKPLPAWIGVVAKTPEEASQQFANRTALFTTGKIPALLKARIAFITARHNRSWYALADAIARLKSLDQSVDAIFSLDEPEKMQLSEVDRQALLLARKITVQPQLITDAEIEALRPTMSDHEIGEVVFASAAGNWFDRITEPVGLPVGR
jgi:alkylhydroperoxidase family enzyme